MFLEPCRLTAGLFEYRTPPVEREVPTGYPLRSFLLVAYVPFAVQTTDTPEIIRLQVANAGHADIKYSEMRLLRLFYRQRLEHFTLEVLARVCLQTLADK